MAAQKSETKPKDKVNVKNANPIQQKTDKDEKTGPLFYVLVVLTALTIMVAVFGGAFFMIIHNNINGLGEKFRKDLQNIPVLKLALPKVPDPLNEKYMSEAEVRKKYTKQRKDMEKLLNELDSVNKKIEDLEKAEQESAAIKNESEKAVKDAEKQKALLMQEQKKLDEDRRKLNELAAQTDKQGFRAYFEQLDSETAQKIYKEIIQEEKVSEQVKTFVKLYENMDPSNAASILEQFGTAKIDLVAEILKNTKNVTTSKILSSMTPAYAAKVTEKLSAYYLAKK